jgi:hypothetical protein
MINAALALADPGTVSSTTRNPLGSSCTLVEKSIAPTLGATAGRVTTHATKPTDRQSQSPRRCNRFRLFKLCGYITERAEVSLRARPSLRLVTKPRQRGHTAKEAGREVGKAGKDVGKKVGQAGKDTGKAVKKAVKGE